jgi:hypothetical protein
MNMSTNTRMTLADFAKKNLPRQKTLEVEWNGETLAVKAKRISVASILCIEGMDKIMQDGQAEPNDFETKDTLEGLGEKLTAMDEFLSMATEEEDEDIRVLPLPLKSKIFAAVFQFQQLSGGEFRSSK